jgi:group I intron endonuclease
MNVYCITFPHGKKYVGVESKTGQRKRDHSRSGRRGKRLTFVARAVAKYGWENCNFEYLAQDLLPEDGWLMEIRLIKEWKLQDRAHGYNISAGGDKGAWGVKRTPEVRERMAAAKRGRFTHLQSTETRAKISAANKGNRPAESTILAGRVWRESDDAKEKYKLRAANAKGKRPSHAGFTGRSHTAESRAKTSEKVAGDKNPFFGRKHTEETKQKIRDAFARRREQELGVC